jgi:hypothetical protein
MAPEKAVSAAAHRGELTPEKRGTARLSAEPDVDHRVQLNVVRRGADHAVLVIEEAEPSNGDLLVEIVPAVEADQYRSVT